MNLEEAYKKLYEQWLEEFDEIKLTRLSNERLNSYRLCLKSLKEIRLNKEDFIQEQVLKKYQENFNYLYKDLLKMREVKIINAAFSLKDLNPNDMVEAEKLLHQKLISTIKGYSKIKSLASMGKLNEKVKESSLITERGHDYLEEETPGLISSRINNEQSVEKPELKSINDKKIKIGENFIQEETTVQKTRQIQDDEQKKEQNSEAEAQQIRSEAEHEYSLIRFLKRTPPIVGIDLVYYGPFKKEDIAYIPKNNAIILLLEKVAEKIDLSSIK